MRAAKRVVIIGASAGGPLAIGDVLSALPEDVDAAVIVVLHLLADHPSLLANVLARRSALPVTQARDGEVLEIAHVYVAPPDAHLVIGPDRRLVLDPSPPVSFHRPSINRTLESAADVFDGEAVAVILSGTGSDGAAGAARVRAAGGRVFAQADADFDSMPAAAVAAGAVDQVLPLVAIAPAVAEFAGVAAA